MSQDFFFSALFSANASDKLMRLWIYFIRLIQTLFFTTYLLASFETQLWELSQTKTPQNNHQAFPSALVLQRWAWTDHQVQFRDAIGIPACLSAKLHQTALAPQTTHTHTHKGMCTLDKMYAHNLAFCESRSAGKHSGDTGMERLPGNEGCGGSAHAQSHTFSLLPPLSPLHNCFYFRELRPSRRRAAADRSLNRPAEGR